MDQPKVTDFTMIEDADHGSVVLSVKLDSGKVRLADYASRGDAEAIELAINQAMIEYHTKRNAWETQERLANSPVRQVFGRQGQQPKG